MPAESGNSTDIRTMRAIAAGAIANDCPTMRPTSATPSGTTTIDSNARIAISASA